MATAQPAPNRAEEYVDGVLSGRIVAGKWVRLACLRHRRDRDLANVEGGHPRGLKFDEATGQHAINFFKFLRHSKGEWAGKVFVLEPWEEFILWTIFGWKNAEGFRVFRTAYIEVARKNGKSTLMAGIGLYLFFADGEPGAEVYCAATKRDQAKIVWSEAKRMAQSSPSIRRRVTILTANLSMGSTASKFEPLGADEDTLDGLNPHGNIVDELHAHKSRTVWDVMETGTGARRQPLQFAITTAGFDKHSVCWEQHKYVEQILEAVERGDEAFFDDSYFGIIYTIDEGDDWRDPAVWPKSNPNLGVSVKIDDFAQKAKQAAEIPTKQNAFLRRRMNVWTESETRWFSSEQWDACAGIADPEALRGRRCYAALDISSTQDTTSEALVFPPEEDGDKWAVLLRVFIPQDNIEKRVKKDRVPYDVWVRQGLVKTTPGNCVDQDFIKAQILSDAATYDMQELAFDRWESAKLVTELQSEGITTVAFGQGFQSMAPAVKQAETLVLAKQVAHGGNPVLAWMMRNVVMLQDPAGNAKPDKAKSRERIDGIVAWLMALDRATRNLEEDAGGVDVW